MKEADAKEIPIGGKFEIIVLCIEYMWWIDETGKLFYSLVWIWISSIIDLFRKIFFWNYSPEKMTSYIFGVYN